MKAIRDILIGTSAVTSLLRNGAAGVKYLMETQGEKNPFITIDSDLADPNSSMSGDNLDEITVTVTSWSDYLYTTANGNIGAYEIAEAVRIALTSASGSHAGFTVRKINILTQSTQTYKNASRDRVAVEQDYQLYINR